MAWFSLKVLSSTELLVLPAATIAPPFLAVFFQKLLPLTCSVAWSCTNTAPPPAALQLLMLLSAIATCDTSKQHVDCNFKKTVFSLHCIRLQSEFIHVAAHNGCSLWLQVRNYCNRLNATEFLPWSHVVIEKTVRTLFRQARVVVQS